MRARWVVVVLGSMHRLGTRALENAFGRPRGVLGLLGGALMAYGNAATEREVVRVAQLAETDRVAVIGPGPGIGLCAAGERAAWAVGVEPSARMRQAAHQRCADLVRAGIVELREGSAEATGLASASITVVLAVNNAQLWPDRPAALAELYRVLRPDGLMVLSSHLKWLPGGQARHEAEVGAAGFREVQSWTWEPPGRGATTAAQLRARRPPEG